jgi:hypothetical protein
MVSQLIHRDGGVGTLLATTLAVIAFATSIMGQSGQPAGAAKRGEPFELKVHEASRLADENLSVRFDGVTEDSRCPVGVQCIWAGDAAVELTVERPPASTEMLTLHTNDRFGRQAAYEGLVVRLVDLKPQPREGTTIAPEDYRVTLVVDRANQARGVGGGIRPR